MEMTMTPRPTTMNILPNDIIRYIGDELLTPYERTCLSTCSSYYRTILPAALRVKIISSRGDSTLQPEFFVSPIEHPTQYISSTDNLLFGHQYFFWTFDYARGNKVYLGRHTRHGGREPDEEGKTQSLYTVGLRPCQPNQAWEITGGDYGDVVMWGEDIGLSVSGTNPQPRHPDSSQPSTLSCFTIPQCQQPMWLVLNNNNNNNNNNNSMHNLEEEQPSTTNGPNEKVQLLRCQEFVPGEDVSEKEISVYAIPEVCDEGEYLLFNPDSMKDGIVGCEGYHVIVDFRFWIENGIMHFSAPALPFTLGIPVLETDDLFPEPTSSSSSSSSASTNTTISPLSNLLEIKSARWGCVIYYMAVAADVGDGIDLNMTRFVRGVTDHADHDVVYDETNKLVSVRVRHKQVDKQFPPTRREDRTKLWSFILSW